MNSGQITLRPTTSQDADFCFSLAMERAEDSLQELALASVAKEDLVRGQAVSFLAGLSGGAARGVDRIVERAGRPVGRLVLTIEDDVRCIHDLSISAAERNRGIGGIVLENVLAEADAARNDVRLMVLRRNPAQRLYQRLGFVTVDDDGLNLQMFRRFSAIVSDAPTAADPRDNEQRQQLRLAYRGA